MDDGRSLLITSSGSSHMVCAFY